MPVSSKNWKILAAILAALAGANLLVLPHHPHFEAEALPGFWAAFGFLGGLALCVAAGAMLGPLVRVRREGGDGS